MRRTLTLNRRQYASVYIDDLQIIRILEKILRSSLSERNGRMREKGTKKNDNFDKF